MFGTLFFLGLSDSYLADRFTYIVLIQVTIATILLPISFYFLLKNYKKVDTVMISSVAQRKIPLMIQICLLFLLIRKSSAIGLIPELYFFFMGGLISAGAAFLYLYGNVKSSLHMIGISSLTGFAIGLSMHYQVNITNSIVSLLLLNGLIASSRLEMKAHTVTELIIGIAMGFMPQVVLWYFWL